MGAPTQRKNTYTYKILLNNGPVNNNSKNTNETDSQEIQQIKKFRDLEIGNK